MWPVVQSSPYYLVVVRAGEAELFDALREGLAREPYPAILMWDRRQRDRRVLVRAAAERRRVQRRAAPDAKWKTAGFIVVELNRAPDVPDTCYINAAAEARRKLDLLGSTGGSKPDAASRPDKSQRLFGLAMFETRLRARAEERRLARLAASRRQG